MDKILDNDYHGIVSGIRRKYTISREVYEGFNKRWEVEIETRSLSEAFLAWLKCYHKDGLTKVEILSIRETGRYYGCRIVWLKKQKILGVCSHAVDGKCTVFYKGVTDVFFGKQFNSPFTKDTLQHYQMACHKI